MARGTIHGQGYYTWPGVLYMARDTIHGQTCIYMARGTILYSTWPYMYPRGSCPSVGKDFEMPRRTEAGG